MIEEETFKILSVVEVEDDFDYQYLPTLSYVMQNYPFTLNIYPFDLPRFDTECFGLVNLLFCAGCVLSRLLAESIIVEEEE